MKDYLFKDKYFGITEEGLHLLRNNYNYKTIPMNELESFRVGRGRAIKNWLLILILGIGMLAASAWLWLGIIDFFTNPDYEGKMHIGVIVGAAVLVFLGGYCVFLGLKKEEVISFSFGKGGDSFATKELKERRQLEPLVDYLKEKIRFDS